MSGSVVAQNGIAAAADNAFWDPPDAMAERRASGSTILTSDLGSPRPAAERTEAIPTRQDSRHRSHHHSRHGEHGHRVRWRGRSKWPAQMKRSAAAVTVFTALLAWFWLLIGSCDPPPVGP